jgi:hypothetical protein
VGLGVAERRLPRFGFLLAAMLAELTLAPFIVMATGGLMIARVLGAIVLLAALSTTGYHRTPIVLFVAALICHVAAMVAPGSLLAAGTEATRFVFLAYVLVLVVWRVLRDRTVTFDTVAGAACAYFLLGVMWGELFMLVERWRPGSFAVPATWMVGPTGDLRSALMYFSFATLTTVGYGDIHPNDPAAGTLCASEALMGQLYLAIMIARMVGLHTSQRSG